MPSSQNPAGRSSDDTEAYALTRNVRSGNQYGDTVVTNGASAHIGDVIHTYYIVKEAGTAYETHRLKELLDSLPSLSFDVKHEAVYDQCMLGTGQWFLDSILFKRWLAEPEQTLWCPGIPGAGKTCMASIVTEHLKSFCAENTSCANACIYLDYGNRDQQTPPVLFGNLLAQLLRRQSNMSQALLDKYEELAKSRKTFRKDHYISLLSIAVKSYSKVFVVVDALDECAGEHRINIITGLRSVGSQVNILVTSRPIGEIAKLFENQPKQDIYAADSDMAAYMRKQIADDVELSSMVEDDQELEEEIVGALLERAQTMFLLVRLHLESLSSLLTIDEVRGALKVLPQQLDATYDEALKRICEQVERLKTLGLNVLTWLMVSRRPMSLTELHHALSVKQEQRKFAKSSLINNIHRLASTCAGLVIMDQKSDTIRLVHYTAQEYLAKHMNQLHARPHAAVATACLTYLHFEDFDHVVTKDKVLERFPFSAYAARHWGWHLARAGALEPHVQAQAVSLLQKETRVTDTFMLEPSPLDGSDTDQHRNFINRAEPRGLHIAAHFGVCGIFQDLIAAGGRLDCRDGRGNTPLHYAAWTGQDSILQLYRQMSADIMVQNDSPYWRSVPLQCAAANGQADFVASLIDAGADANYNPEEPAGTDFAGPAMHEAIIRDQLQVVQRLHELRANIDLISMKWGTTPLDHACERVRLETMKLLLQCGASFAGEKGHQALSRLVRRDYAEPPKQYLSAMALLCQLDINLNRPLEYCYRALDYELSFGHGPAIKMLLDAGARPALTWYNDQPAVQKWVNEPWFAQLHSVCANQPQPCLTSDEVQRTTAIRGRDVEDVFTMDPDTHKGRTSLYYTSPRPYLLPGGVQSLNQEVFKRTHPYLQIEIPQNMFCITKIVITTESHDQGYTDFDKNLNGTYGLSYTWFDLLFMYHKHPQHPIWQDTVQVNVNASRDWKTHVNTWDVKNWTDSRAWARADAMWQLRPGDHVALYARAFFPGWENHVKRAEIRIEGLEKKVANP